MAPAGGGLKPDSAIATQAPFTKLDRIMARLLARPRAGPIAPMGLMAQNRSRSEHEAVRPGQSTTPRAFWRSRCLDRATEWLDKARPARPRGSGAMKRSIWGLGFFALTMMSAGAGAQTANNIVALKGLAPVSALSNSMAGRAALAANFSVTGGIQTGAIRQPTLLPFADQQQQALRDAFITDGNAYQLADGLGTKLGDAYQRLTSYTRDADGTEDYTNVSSAVANLI